MNVYAQRLLNVARATRESSADRFNMSTFAHKCGTPGCAFGNYAARNDLQDDFALILKGVSMFGGIHYEWYPVVLETGEFGGAADPTLCKHFGINAQEACHLFSTTGCGQAYCDPEKAISYIESFVARKWPDLRRPTSAMLADLMARVNGERIPEDVT